MSGEVTQPTELLPRLAAMDGGGRAADGLSPSLGFSLGTAATPPTTKRVGFFFPLSLTL